MRAFGIALLAFLAGLAGVVAGRLLLPRPLAPPQGSSSVFAFVLDRLDIDARQRAQVEAHEAMYRAQRDGLERQLRASNGALAAAIKREHRNGPLVRAAVDRTHVTMGALQKATLDHLFEVRAILRPDQARRFDGEVERSLTATDR
ncbi:periplasmic heavy metal sensor [uncultured Sphingomonas sp.]|uniref:periplasmic heavy metal sensor n=1 Tax=uncultured Sphingomonas sp. TaxID=158754 RepID=UPI0025DE4644|nr:periplasmic heavy metal sensor [uncultured Sphingomonas sp.]